MRKASERELDVVVQLGKPFLQALLSIEPRLIAPLMVYVNAMLMMNLENTENVSRCDSWDEIAKSIRTTIEANEKLMKEQANG